MQKGFGLIGILIVVALVAGISAFVFESVFPERSPFTPSEEEKSAIDTAEDMKDVMEEKSAETTQVSSTTEDETANWKTYRNEEYGFEFKYPAKLEMEPAENWTSFYFCEGSIKKYSDNLGPEGVSEVCEGTDYRLFVSMHEQIFDPNNLPDDAELQKPVKKLSVNGKDFYIARHEVYTYVGWDVYASLHEKTLQLGFSGDGFVLQQSSIISDKEEEVIKSILSTFKFLP